MANILELNAQTRQRSGSASVRRMRKEGLVPAVIYGRKTGNSNIKVNTKTVSQLLRESASENVLVNLQIDGATTQLALIQEVQHDHLKGGILHIDFHAVDMNESIHATVPIEVVGDAEGVKAGGQMDIMLHQIEVFCLPKDLPEKIVFDATHVGQGQGVHVKDLKLPEGVSVHLDGDVLILAITEPRVAETPAQAAAAAKK
jgi:large subunit ribosomal protein L25